MTEKDLQARVERIEQSLGLGEDISRRSALAALSGMGGAAFLAGRASASHDDNTDFVGDFAILSGPLDDSGKPVQDAEGRQRYVYLAPEEHTGAATDRFFYTEWHTDQWMELSLGDPGAQPQVSDDGTQVLASTEGLNFADFLTVTDDGDGTVTIAADGVLARPTAITQPALSMDTWRTPNTDRPTFISATVDLNPGATTRAEVALDVDESGGTTPDYSHPNDVPGGLEAEQTRPVSSVVVPAGGAYRFRTVSVGDGVGINSLVEHTI